MTGEGDLFLPLLPINKEGDHQGRPVSRSIGLLNVVMRFVIKDHAFANYLYGLEFFEHDRLTAFGANAGGEMVDLFAVRQRCARCL
jgi:hypothetical protein